MATTTPVNGWSIPALGDAPNIVTAVNTFANAVDQRVIPIFATTALRDSAIPAPVAGQACYVTATTERYTYTGTTWASGVPRTKYKAALEQVTNSTTLQDDDDLFFTVEANSVYAINWSLAIVCGSVAPDFKFDFSIPAGCTYRTSFYGYVAGVFMTTVINENPAVGRPLVADTLPGTVGVLLQGVFKVTTAGSIKLQFAQNAANLSFPTGVDLYSYASAIKMT